MAKKKRRPAQPEGVPDRPVHIRQPRSHDYLGRNRFPRDTSALSWSSLVNSNLLGMRQGQVYGFIRANQDDPEYLLMISEQDIADAFNGDSTRSFRPRIAELLDAGVIVQVGHKEFRKFQRAYRTTGKILSRDERPRRRKAGTVMREVRANLYRIQNKSSERLTAKLQESVDLISEWLSPTEALGDNAIRDEQRRRES